MIPLFSNVLIEIQKQSTVTSSGIHLAVSEDKKLEKAIVLSIGEDCTKLKVGETILFKAYSADTIELDQKEITFIKEEDILAIV